MFQQCGWGFRLVGCGFVLTMAELGLMFAVPHFLGRCRKGTTCKCVLMLMLVGIAFWPGSESYIQVSLKCMNSFVFKIQGRG